jgi:DNA-binding winged helix-turn-helix (wHTH) protein/serine/threonine protein kinase
MGTAASGRVWSFAGCEYDESRLELRVGGKPVDLELKPLELLQHLLTHADQVVTKEQLLDAVWPGLTVVDASLATAISKLRKALGDRDATIVITVTRVGYRLAAPVRCAQAAPLAVGSEPSFKPEDRVQRRHPWRLVRSLATPETRNVWLAEHPETHERRVFKFANSGARLKSLKREVTVSRFLHESLGERPDLVRVLEWNFDASPYSIESEYGGPNLLEWADAQGGLDKIPLDRRVRLLAAVAGAVAAAHEAGVLHRDLKPTNLLVASAASDEQQIRVVDFGSAALVEPERLQALGITNLGLTQTATVRESSLTGSLMYLAPELFAGASPGAPADVFALGVILYQLVVGNFHKPLSAGWEADVDDPVLRQDIADAACGDPARRLSGAAALADRMLNLDRRRQEYEGVERGKEREQIAQRKRADARIRRPWMVFAAVASVVVALLVTLNFYKPASPSSPRPHAVAVLPFHNASPDSGMDFLRFALADEIATTLSRMRPLAIRPSAATSKYTGLSIDLQAAGRELGASTIVTGRYLLVGEQLQITVEAADVANNHLMWRDTVNVPAGNLLALQAQISAMARGKLATALGASEFVRQTSAPPQNEDAYNLYLRSLALSYDPVPNKEALEMLEQTVKLDPTYAPAWFALSGRSYVHSRFGGGRDAFLRRSDEASERALALDSDYVDAAAELILHRVERGDLARALQQAGDLVRRRPDNAQTHHLLNYALRYAGYLPEAGRQCDMAMLLDPQITWGSCSSTFMELREYTRAKDFLRKDLSSEWSKAHAVEILVREGRTEEAIRIGPPSVPHWESYKMLLACAAGRSGPEIGSMASAVEVSDDPEVNYFFAAHLAYCGQADAALRFLELAIDGNHCSYPAIDLDPFFDAMRTSPEFARTRAGAIACHDRLAPAARACCTN